MGQTRRTLKKNKTKCKRKTKKVGGATTNTTLKPTTNTNTNAKFNNANLNKMNDEMNAKINNMSDAITSPLESGVAVLQNPQVKKVLQDGLVELVDDAKPALNKLAHDSMSLVANVAEDVAGPFIGIPRTLGNMADIAETGIGLLQKTLGKVSDMSNAITSATNDASTTIAGLKQSQERALNNSQKSIQQLTNAASTDNIHKKINKTINQTRVGGGGGSKTRKKRSVFQQMHAYF